MKSAFPTLVLALGIGMCMVTATAASDVLVLTDKNFDDTLKEHTNILVEFYAPWCGHCKSLAPEYEKAATAMKEIDGTVKLAKVDATAETATAEKFEVRGFPTLKFFRDGTPTDYSGGRTETAIVNWLKKKTGPPATVLDSKEALETFQNSEDVVAIGFFSGESDEKAAFLKAAFASEEIPFGIATETFDIEGASDKSVMVHKTFDDGSAFYDGDATDSASIVSFVNAEALPLVIPFSQDSAPKIFGGDIKNQVLIFSDNEADAHKSIVEACTASARLHKGKFLFVTIPPDVSRIMEFFGITEDKIPAVRLVHMGKGAMRKYEYTEDDINTENLNKFLADYTAGNLKPALKSEPIPSDNSGPVTVLVGKNFDDVVLNNDNDVLVEFYAPWCGHCKRLAPTYDELGNKFAHIDHITIAKMDATANEHEAVEVSGFPTLKFWKAGAKDTPVDYEGARDLEGFLGFLEKHASKEYDLDAAEGSAKEEL
jgi:protein disulfide-isomerase A1